MGCSEPLDVYTKMAKIKKINYQKFGKKQVKESDLESLVCSRLKEARFKALKFYSDVDTGWMDRIFLSPTGITLWVEFKKPTGKLAPLQRVNRNWLIRNGHAYYLLDTLELCQWFLAKVVPLLLKH